LECGDSSPLFADFSQALENQSAHSKSAPLVVETRERAVMNHRTPKGRLFNA
jgi:hypothetical protein